MNNYTVIHLHSQLSNPTTVMDSVTGYKDYVDKAKECGMQSICFTEHGNMFEWLHKKEYCEKNGLKYIHGVEAYVTKSLNEKVRDNFHTVLIATNFESVKELNHIMSHKVAFKRDDGHFYYVPRITYDELKNLSDDVIITSACLGGILNKADEEMQQDFIKFMTKNKHRCFLEIQQHLVESQSLYNKKLYDISQKTGIRLVMGTDTHALNEEHLKGRSVLQKSKNTFFEDEESWDLSFKTYDELMNACKKQNAIPFDAYLDAIQNTNVIADMVGEFEMDRSHKYPKLYDNSEQVFKEKIQSYIKEKNIQVNDTIKDRVNHEFETYKKNGAIDFMLLEENIKKWCRDNDILYGYSRGSVSGSYIAYLLGITDVDSIKYDLIFERFMNPERVSLADKILSLIDEV